MCKPRTLLLILVPLMALASGCPTPYTNNVDPLLPEISRIQSNTTLSPQQQRQQLSDLGLSPVLINGLLRSVRLANQFGGDLRTAYEKVVGAHLDQLTPDEVQVFADEAGTVDTSVQFTLTDVQAQAMVDLLQQNHLATKDELSAFLADSANAGLISAAIPAGALTGLFVTFDPSKLLPLLP